MDEKITVEYYPNGFVKEKKWLRNGVAHREDGPAIIEYDESGFPHRMMWVLYGMAHREDGAACVRVKSTNDGRFYFENIYYFMGKSVWHFPEYDEIVELVQSFKDCNRNILLLNVRHKNEFISRYCKHKLKYEEF